MTSGRQPTWGGPAWPGRVPGGPRGARIVLVALHHAATKQYDVLEGHPAHHRRAKVMGVTGAEAARAREAGSTRE